MKQTFPLSTSTLANGLRVAINHDPWVPGVAVNLWYDVGSSDEQRGRTGFAHLFEHLMFSGSANVANGEFDTIMQQVGGHSNASTNFDCTNYYEVVPASAVELALWLEADRLSTLLERVDQTNLDTQRDVVKEEKRQSHDNVPYGDAFEHLLALTFPADHPYAHLPIGSMADLDDATLDDVHQFFRRYYRPDNLIVSLAGAIEPDRGLELVNHYLGEVAMAPTNPRPTVAALPAMTALSRQEVVASVPQDVIYLTWRIPPISDPGNDALNIWLSVISGSMTSRLTEGLVRTNLADSVDCYDLGLNRGNSVVVATAACVEGVSPEQLEEAMSSLWEQAINQGPTAVELDRAKRLEDLQYLSDCASTRSRAEHIGAAWALFNDADEINHHLDDIHALTTDAVAQAASQWLRPEQRAVLTYRRSA
ncbi:MAG: insulinase family protein [Propionibacteriaceae bacterium]|nr:insulinase family protein [Propionibacteriaceae bacterium]